MNQSHYEDQIAFILKCQRIKFERQYPFDRTKKWPFKADFAILSKKVIIEIDGGIYKKGKSGHTSGKGYEKGCEKLNSATLLGWKVFRIPTNWIPMHGQKGNPEQFWKVIDSIE